MRYNVHSPCAFHHRITKYLGVLVASALIATLGLPSAAQAQTPEAPKVTGVGDGMTVGGGTLTATWGAGTVTEQTHWKVEYTEPGVPWANAKALDLIDKGIFTTPMAGENRIMANDSRIHHGVWKVRVSYWDSEVTQTDDDPPVAIVGGARIGMPSATTDYYHGPPSDAPTGLAVYNAGSDALRIVWDDVENAAMYELRYTADPTDDDEWEDWDSATSGSTVAMLKAGTEYTFEVRGLAETRAGVGDLHGPSARITEMLAAADPDPPEMPTGFIADDAGRLAWNVVTGTSYETRYTADETDDDAWTDWETATNGMVADDLEMGVEYTFQLRAGIGDLHSPSASIMVMIATPTPTLPEIALLLLAMLLLGSGVYLLRGRQSGGLTHA